VLLVARIQFRVFPEEPGNLLLHDLAQFRISICRTGEDRFHAICWLLLFVYNLLLSDNGLLIPVEFIQGDPEELGDLPTRIDL
jgi:hypothetical protein